MIYYWYNTSQHYLDFFRLDYIIGFVTIYHTF